MKKTLIMLTGATLGCFVVRFSQWRVNEKGQRQIGILQKKRKRATSFPKFLITLPCFRHADTLCFLDTLHQRIRMREE